MVMNAKSKPNKEYEKLKKNKEIGSSTTPILLYFFFSSSSQFGKCSLLLLNLENATTTTLSLHTLYVIQ